MLRFLALLLAIASCTATLDNYMIDRLKVNPHFKLGCLLEHCLTVTMKCFESKLCREAMTCSEGCFENWDKDTSKEKFTVQNCTNICSFTYGEEPAFKDMFACYTENVCISFPKIPNTCRGPNVKPVKQLTLGDIQGHWWVVRGYHKVYDCYPCQQIEFKVINNTAWLYTPRYETYMVNGSLYYVRDQNFVMPNVQPGHQITFTYEDLGLEHTETWWLLDMAADKSYFQMYYCGNTLQWYYEGSLVLAKGRSLTANDYTKIAAVYKEAVGLDLNDYCYTDTSSSCPPW